MLMSAFCQRSFWIGCMQTRRSVTARAPTDFRKGDGMSTWQQSAKPLGLAVNLTVWLYAVPYRRFGQLSGRIQFRHILRDLSRENVHCGLLLQDPRNWHTDTSVTSFQQSFH